MNTQKFFPLVIMLEGRFAFINDNEQIFLHRFAQVWNAHVSKGFFLMRKLSHKFDEVII